MLFKKRGVRTNLDIYVFILVYIVSMAIVCPTRLSFYDYISIVIVYILLYMFTMDIVRKYLFYRLELLVW